MERYTRKESNVLSKDDAPDERSLVTWSVEVVLAAIVEGTESFRKATVKEMLESASSVFKNE